MRERRAKERGAAGTQRRGAARAKRGKKGEAWRGMRAGGWGMLRSRAGRGLARERRSGAAALARVFLSSSAAAAAAVVAEAELRKKIASGARGVERTAACTHTRRSRHAQNCGIFAYVNPRDRALEGDAAPAASFFFGSRASSKSRAAAALRE